MEEGTLFFLDLHNMLFDEVDEPRSLRPFLDLIRSTVDKIAPSEPTSEGTDSILVVLEDFSITEWAGYSTKEIGKFYRALAAFCAKVRRGYHQSLPLSHFVFSFDLYYQRSISLVIRHHLLFPEEPDDLFRLLYQLCASYIEVRPLASGRSGAVSGEVTLSLHYNFFFFDSPTELSHST